MAETVLDARAHPVPGSGEGPRKPPKIAPGRARVAGGGIAGLAAAIALARAGWEVSVHERAARFEEVGAGLQMSPNASRVLRWLGVLDQVAAVGFQPERAELRDGQTGALVYEVPLARAAEIRWGAPYIHVHRADLVAVLAEAAEAAGVALNTGDAVVSYGNRPEGVRLTMADGRTITGDLAIGADGLRSAVRGVLNGEEAPDFSGQVVWRGTVPVEALPEGTVTPTATVWAGPGRHVVSYLLRGGRLANVVAAEERDEWAEESWSVAGDPERLRAAFDGWHPRVTALLGALERPLLWGLFVRPEQVRWADGRVALIGDAAHAMLPYMAQGAAMALEDVAALSRALTRAPDVPAALLTFEEARWQRVVRVQERARANGRLFHRRNATTRAMERWPMSLVSTFAPSLAAAQLDWLYGHDATAGMS